MVEEKIQKIKAEIEDAKSKFDFQNFGLDLSVY